MFIMKRSFVLEYFSIIVYKNKWTRRGMPMSLNEVNIVYFSFFSKKKNKVGRNGKLN